MKNEKLTTDYGNGIVGPSRAELRAAVDGIESSIDDWTAIKPLMRPVFIRKRPLPPGVDRPLTKNHGIVGEVALGADIGPAFMYVGAHLLEAWGKTFDEAYEVALANLRGALEAERYVEMEYESIDNEPFWWYQSSGGLASGLLLLEDQLAIRYGPEPKLLVAPMRNLLMACSLTADMTLVRWLRDEVANADPNGLALPVFALVDGKLGLAPMTGEGSI